MSRAKSITRAKSSTNLGAIVSLELKERLKKYADVKRWSMSQATAVLIEEGLDRYELELQSESNSNYDKNKRE